MDLTFEQWIVMVSSSPHPHQRYGQYLWNQLSGVRNDITSKLVGTELDPFYEDSRVSAFLTRVAEMW